MKDLKKIQEFFSKPLEENSSARVSMPKFVKDKNNPNFLNVYIKYDTGAGATMALGRETGSGQDRRNNAAEAMKLANDVARDLEAEYNIEDIEITDQENGVVSIFAVSDDFINMAAVRRNPNMLGEVKEENTLSPEDFPSNFKQGDTVYVFDRIKGDRAMYYNPMIKGDKAVFKSRKEMDSLLDESVVTEVKIGDKVKINKEYGGGKGTIEDIVGSFVVVNGKSYHESDVEKVDLDEEKGYSPQLVTPENPKGETKGLTPDVMNKILMKVIQDIDESRNKINKA